MFHTSATTTLGSKQRGTFRFWMKHKVFRCLKLHLNIATLSGSYFLSGMNQSHCLHAQFCPQSLNKRRTQSSSREQPNQQRRNQESNLSDMRSRKHTHSHRCQFCLPRTDTVFSLEIMSQFCVCMQWFCLFVIFFLKITVFCALYKKYCMNIFFFFCT